MLTQSNVCLTPASGVSDIVWAKVTIVSVKLKDSGKAGHAQSERELSCSETLSHCLLSCACPSTIQRVKEKKSLCFSAIIRGASKDGSPEPYKGDMAEHTWVLDKNNVKKQKRGYARTRRGRSWAGYSDRPRPKVPEGGWRLLYSWGFWVGRNL